MSKIRWYVNRMKAMNVKEIVWRFNQKLIQCEEKKRFGAKRISVASEIWNPLFRGLSFDCNALGLYFDNKTYGTNIEIHLLKGADYNKWPDVFSYSLNYKQRDDLGDARTNWEKNRHFQWALMAKAYYLTGEKKYFDLLNVEVCEWMDVNPFLYGISWTSAMEFAIRSINWMYANAFIVKSLDKYSNDANILALSEKLNAGIINITEYLTKHYSRYSSANNHLLVEATAIGLAGFAFYNEEWINLACRILSEELCKQNYSDGVNRELSLHYQTFGMEAYLLMSNIMLKRKTNNSELKDIVESWMPMLNKEAEYVAYSSWREKTVCEFGDDDEGKIIDLQGGAWHQWEWVLQFVSLVTGVRYSSFEHVCENTSWMFTRDEIDAIKKKSMFNGKDRLTSKCFEVGGNTFLRDNDDRILIGIDHADLGFGSIAAHGHADALSFQLFVDGQPVITDPGTYIYHCDLASRNAFRKTINHSTLCLLSETGTPMDQSEMLGAFLWGKRAITKLESVKIEDSYDKLVALHDGYKPNVHQRSFIWDKIGRSLLIKDNLKLSSPWIVTFMIGSDVEVIVKEEYVTLFFASGKLTMFFWGGDHVEVENAEVSVEYGVKIQSKAVRVFGNGCNLCTKIQLFID